NVAWFGQHYRRLGELAAQSHLPAISHFRAFAEAGGLLVFMRTRGVADRAAAQGGKILPGSKPTDVPVEQPMWFKLILNLKTAKALGLTLPSSVLLQVDEVIQ